MVHLYTYSCGHEVLKNDMLLGLQQLVFIAYGHSVLGALVTFFIKFSLLCFNLWNALETLVLTGCIGSLFTLLTYQALRLESDMYNVSNKSVFT